MSQWISVKDHLPSKTGTQIVTIEADRDDFTSVGFFTADNRWFAELIVPFKNAHLNWPVKLEAF